MYCQTEERMEYYLVKALLTKPLFLLAVTFPRTFMSNNSRSKKQAEAELKCSAWKDFRI